MSHKKLSKNSQTKIHVMVTYSKSIQTLKLEKENQTKKENKKELKISIMH